MTLKVMPFPKSDGLPNWVTSSFSKMIFDALDEANVRFVGGAVRDSILGLPVSDIDMATTHSPEVVMEKLSAAGLKVIPTGLKHGTVTAVFDKEIREITTLRIDKQTDGRHAVVAYTSDWLADAERRDFTVNAIYLDADGMLYDPFNGLGDLRSRRVRFIGDAAARIKEDGLRILRFYRFSSRFADRIDAKGQAACHSARRQIDNLSSERIRGELLKLLGGAQPDSALKSMTEAGITGHVMPEGFDLAGLLQQLVFDREADSGTSALTRLWLLAGKGTEPTRLAHQFKLSGAEKKRLTQIKTMFEYAGDYTEKCVKQFFYQFDFDVVQEAAQLRCNKSILRLVKEQGALWHGPQFPISAHDLMELGFTAGPMLGNALKGLEGKWLDSDFSLSREDLLKLSIED